MKKIEKGSSILQTLSPKDSANIRKVCQQLGVEMNNLIGVQKVIVAYNAGKQSEGMTLVAAHVGTIHILWDTIHPSIISKYKQVLIKDCTNYYEVWAK